LLALIVELLCCALTGAAFGFEADSFFQDEGNRPRLGQALLVIDPGALAGADGFTARIETLIAAMLADEGVRLPGAKREAQSTRAAAEGLEVADALVASIRALAA
jgi:(2R)-3-sulfolactate dehydrogenase (NADP+)